jgi:hypothetical protein
MDVESRAGAPEAAAVAVDWRGRPCRPQRHGGMRAAVFVLGACVARPAAGDNVHGRAHLS